MNCRRVQSSLAEDLRNRSEAWIAAHLRECEECRGICRDLLKIEELARSLSGRLRVPENFQEEVLAELAREKPSRVFRLSAALAAVVLLGASVSLFRGFYGSDSALREGEPALENVRPDTSRSAEAAYVDVIVTGEGNEEFILRLPSVIEIRRTELQEDFYLSNVSH